MTRWGLLVSVLLCRPWICVAVYAVEDAAGQVRSAHELFDLFGIDERSMQAFTNREPLSEAEHDPLARILMRLPQVNLRDVERWTRRDVLLKDLAAQPQEYQREFIRLSGNVKRVTHETPTAEQQDRYALENYFRCEMSLDGERTAIIYARHVPRAWNPDAAIDERASANAMFLKVGDRLPTGENVMYFASDRVAWHPDTVLGNLGVDCGLLDTIEQLRPITNNDRECFFQLLSAAGRAPPEHFTNRAPDPPAELAPLLKAPSDHLGKLYTFEGVARRAVKIQITDPDTIARFGFDHYFEIVLFVNLDAIVAGERVRSHPVVYCVRQLPPGFPTGEGIAEVATVSGFMFKKWPYSTQATEAKDPDLRMSSPLLIGQTLMWKPHALPERLSIGPIVGILLLAVVGAAAGVVWWFGRRERDLRKAALAQKRSLPAGTSLDHLGLDAAVVGDREQTD